MLLFKNQRLLFDLEKSVIISNQFLDDLDIMWYLMQSMGVLLRF